jgi:hypothetical protein
MGHQIDKPTLPKWNVHFVSVSSNSKAVNLNTVFQLPKTRSRPKLLVRVHLSKYDFDKRLDDQVIWPRPNPKKIRIKKFASHFLTSSPSVRRLRDDGILPLLKFPTSEVGLLLYWSNPVSQVLRAMAFKRKTCGRSNFGELMTVKIS